MLGLACGTFGNLSNTPSARFLLDAMDRFQIDHDFEFKEESTSDVLVFVEETGRRLLYRQRPQDVSVPFDKLMPWLERAKGGMLTVDTATLQPLVVSEIVASARSVTPRIFTNVTLVDMPVARLQEGDVVRLLANSDMLRLTTETLEELVVALLGGDVVRANEPAATQLSSAGVGLASTYDMGGDRSGNGRPATLTDGALADALRGVALGRRFGLKVVTVTSGSHVVVVAAPGWAFPNLVPSWPSMSAVEARLIGMTTPFANGSAHAGTTSVASVSGDHPTHAGTPPPSPVLLSPTSTLLQVSKLTQWAVFVCRRPVAVPHATPSPTASSAGHRPPTDGAVVAPDLPDPAWAPVAPRGTATARQRQAHSTAPSAPSSTGAALPAAAEGGVGSNGHASPTSPCPPGEIVDAAAGWGAWEDAAGIPTCPTRCVRSGGTSVDPSPVPTVHDLRAGFDTPDVGVTPAPLAALLRQGSLSLQTGTSASHPHRHVVDATGLEEAFDAGLLTGLDIGMPVPFAVLLAQAAVGVCVSQFGPVPSHPASRAAVDAEFDRLIASISVGPSLAAFASKPSDDVAHFDTRLCAARAIAAPAQTLAAVAATLNSPSAIAYLTGDLAAVDKDAVRAAMSCFGSSCLAPFAFDRLEDSGPAQAARDSMQTMIAQINAFSDRFQPCLIAHAVRMIRDTEAMGGRVHVTGIGKPQHVAQYAASLLSSVGTPCTFLHGTEVTHGSAGQVISGDIVFAISNSGNTSELLAAVQAVKSMGAQVVAVTGGLDSALAKMSDLVLDAKVLAEGGGLGLAPRASIAVEILVFAALSAALEEARHLSRREYHRRHPAGVLGQRSRPTH